MFEVICAIFVIVRFKIKAHPVNKKILQGPLKPTVAIEKKSSTVPEPFKLTEVQNKVGKKCFFYSTEHLIILIFGYL